MPKRFFPTLILALAAPLTLQINAGGAELKKMTDRTITNSVGEATDLFFGIDEGLIAVKFIPQDAAEANVLLTNNTDRVLHIQLPRAFAAVPVLAQFAPNAAGQNFGQQNFAREGLAGGGQAGRGATQGVGGGFNAGQGQGLGQAMQFGGPMRIPPGKTRKLTAATVCLEHGKPEPNPRLAYRIVPMEQFTTDQRLARLCGQLGRGEIKQNTAQAVAWHLASGLDWDRLASINRIESRYLGNVRFFSSAELEQAKSLVASLADPQGGEDKYASSDVVSESQ